MIAAVRHFAILAVALCAGAGAADPGALARDAAERMQVLIADGVASPTDPDRMTAILRAHEDGLAALRDGLRQAAEEEAALSAALDRQRRVVATLSGRLMVLGRQPAPILALHPDGADGAARAGMMLRALATRAEEEARTLDRLRAEAAALQALRLAAEDTLRDGLIAAQEARIALRTGMAGTPRARAFEEDAVGRALLLASAETLAAFADNLDLAGAATGEAASTSAPVAPLPLPARGEVTGRFDPEAGSEGLHLSTPAGAVVALPVPLTIRFAGPLLDLGLVAIVEPAPGQLIVLAGLGEIFGAAGDILPAGTAIGLMPDPADDQGKLTEGAPDAGVSSRDTLYIEVREGSAPVDPATIFAVD